MANEQSPDQEAARLLTKKQVLARVGVTYPCLWKWMQSGKFHAHVPLAGKRPG